MYLNFRDNGEVDPSQDGRNNLVEDGGVNYTNYLQLSKVLKAQHLLSEEGGNKVHDEHLFIIIHQGNLFKIHICIYYSIYINISIVLIIS